MVQIVLFTVCLLCSRITASVLLPFDRRFKDLSNSIDSSNNTRMLEVFDLDGVDLVNDDGQIVRGIFRMPMEDVSLLPLNFDEAIHYYLHTRDVYEGVQVRMDRNLTSYGFSNARPTKVLIHGWMNSRRSTVNLQLRRGFLFREDCNVFVVDWSRIADNLVYPIPMLATTEVAATIAIFLNHLVEVEAVTVSSMHIVGHSLGAHISGFAARCVRRGPVGRITGLDPANPGFSQPEVVVGGRLRSQDAAFVDVIHSSASVLGLSVPVGHADFYPNGGGVPQPGCSIANLLTACSHGRSWEYMADSLLTVPWVMEGEQCNSYAHFQDGSCNGRLNVPMGYLCPSSARGLFYLRTGPQSPYAIGAPRNST